MAVHFKIDYVNASGEISNYYPDFIVKKSNKESFIIETKGLEDLDVPLKMERLKQCVLTSTKLNLKSITIISLWIRRISNLIIQKVSMILLRDSENIRTIDRSLGVPLIMDEEYRNYNKMFQFLLNLSQKAKRSFFTTIGPNSKEIGIEFYTQSHLDGCRGKPKFSFPCPTIM